MTRRIDELRLLDTERRNAHVEEHSDHKQMRGAELVHDRILRSTKITQSAQAQVFNDATNCTPMKFREIKFTPVHLGKFTGGRFPALDSPSSKDLTEVKKGTHSSSITVNNHTAVSHDPLTWLLHATHTHYAHFFQN